MNAVPSSSAKATCHLFWTSWTLFGEHLHEPLMSPIFDNGLLEELQENLRVISGIGCRVFRSANKSEGHCFPQHVLEFLNSMNSWIQSIVHLGIWSKIGRINRWVNPNLVGGLEHVLFFHILGMSSSQLTFTPSFFRGVGGSTTNQIS